MFLHRKLKGLDKENNVKLILKKQILELHAGVLLVRLKQKQKSINGLRKQGREKLVNKIEEKQKKKTVILLMPLKKILISVPLISFTVMILNMFEKTNSIAFHF